MSEDTPPVIPPKGYPPKVIPTVTTIEIPSVHSSANPTSPRQRKQLGWAPPTLYIPPPQPYFQPNQPYSANPSVLSGVSNATLHPHYQKRASEFMFNQFNGLKDFTMSTAKSGLGIGEKSAFWLYNKVSSWSRRWFTHFFLTFVIVAYTVGGALVFQTVEGRNEVKIVEIDIRSKRRMLIEELRNLSIVIPREQSIGEWHGIATGKLESFEDYIIDAYKNHALIVANHGPKIWTFWNSVVYCSTIYTTIGYGHLYPTTTTGQALTIVYSLIGIPLFLIILTDFGKLFTRCIKFLWSFVRRLYYTGSCRRYRKTAHAKEIWKGAQMMYDLATFRRPSMFDPNANQSPQESHDGNTTAPPTPAISNFEIDDEFNLPISLAILLLVLYIFLGAVLFGIWEGWDFFASFYFVFISMSTIGFGDYVPRHPIFMIVSIVYLVFGLALMSMCINVVQVKLSDTFNQASAKIGATIGLGVAEEDGSIKTVPPKPVEMPLVHGNLSDINLADKDVPNTSKT